MFLLTKKKIFFVVFLLIVLVTSFVFIYYLKPDIFADLTTPSGYVIFSKSSFDYVLSETKPEESEIIPPGGELSIFAAKGEIEPLTFSIRSNYHLGESRIEITDLDSLYGKGRISKDNVELYNIKLWLQCKGDNKHCDTDPQAAEVPELLLKDNEQDLISAEPGWVNGEYQPPSLNPDFRVNIKANHSHTFYLRIKVPQDTNAGTYVGTVKFVPQKGEERFFQLKLTVLPFILPEPDKDFLVYFNQQIGEGGERKLSPELYSKYLDVFKESGLTSIISYDANSAELVTDLMKKKGFKGSFIQIKIGSLEIDDIRQIAQIVRHNGFVPYFYTYDEPQQSKERMKAHLSRLKLIHDVGEKATTAIKRECVEAMLDPSFPIYQDLTEEGISAPQKLDLNIYGASAGESSGCNRYGEDKYQSFATYLQKLKQGEATKTADKEYYYYQIWGENTVVNRIKTGFFLYNSSLDGIAAYGVQSYYRNKQGAKQYDDFDAPRKNINSLYPSSQGPVLTLQWEAFREGIDDYRYLKKYKDLLNDLRGKDLAQYRELAEELKEKMSVYFFYAANGEHPWELPDSFHQEVRTYIKDKILLVNKMLNPEIILPSPVKESPYSPPNNTENNNQKKDVASDSGFQSDSRTNSKEDSEIAFKESINDLSFLTPRQTSQPSARDDNEKEIENSGNQQGSAESSNLSGSETEGLAGNSDFSTQQQSQDDTSQKIGSLLEEPSSENREATYWLAFVFIALAVVISIAFSLWWLKDRNKEDS